MAHFLIEKAAYYEKSADFGVWIEKILFLALSTLKTDVRNAK